MKLFLRTLVCQSFQTMGIIIQILRASGCIPVKNNNKQPIQCSARNGERKWTVFSCYCSISWWHSGYIFTLWPPRTERCHRYKTLIQIRRSLVEPIRTRVIRKWINVSGDIASAHSFGLWGQMLKRLGPGHFRPQIRCLVALAWHAWERTTAVRAWSNHKLDVLA